MALEYKEFEDIRQYGGVTAANAQNTEVDQDMWARRARVTGSAHILFEDNGLRAYVVTTPPPNGMLNVDEREIREFMAAHGITHGIVDDFYNSINRGAKSRTLVAEGTPPVQGDPARLRMVFTEDAPEQTPSETSDVNVDHRRVQSFIKVRPGQVLAEKTPPGAGREGLSVTGEPIPAQPGDDLLLIPGQNTAVSKDGRFLIATTAGCVRQEQDRVDVVELYEVHGDVDYSVGNIDFEGCVRVNGNVLPGFTIAATDDIEIMGNVERATLEAGGDILVHQGYYGDGNCHMKSCGSLRVRSLENAVVKALNDIHIEQYSNNSDILAGGNVYVTNTRHGRIAGGRVTAGGNLFVMNLGSPSYSSTVVDVGKKVEIGTDKSHYFNTMRYYNNTLERINEAIAWLKNQHITQPLNKRQMEQLHTLENKARRIRESIRTLIRNNSQFNTRRKQTPHSDVHITGTGYCGVQVQSTDRFIDFTNDMQGVLIRSRPEGLFTDSLG